MAQSLPVVNLKEAKFECIYGRGCDGICCQNGRPGVDPEEVERIELNLEKFLPHLRPEARELIEEDGFLSRRRKDGLPMLRVIGGWCVFFHQGCVLHKVGTEEGDKYQYKPAQCALFPLAKDAQGRWFVRQTEEGDKYQYKPAQCALFPLAKDAQGRWFVRQHGVEDEEWDLFCLNPKATNKPAAHSLKEEIALALRFDSEAAAAKC
jgi:hypothetical protein